MGTSSSKTLDALAQQDLFVKNPRAIPMLRNLSTIIVDKKALVGSGVVSNVWLNGETYNAYQLHECRNASSQQKKVIDATLNEMHACVALCCGKRIEEGLPHERQLLSFMDSIKDTDKVRYYYTEKHKKPYSTEQLFVATMGKHLDRTLCLYALGMVEAIVPHCAFILNEGEPQTFTDEWHDRVSQYCKTFTSAGHNVFALAMRVSRRGNDTEEEVEENLFSGEGLPDDLVFLGMMQVADNVKPHAKDMLQLCKENNIRLIFTSEDDAAIVKKQAIAVGVATEQDNILSGEELQKVSAEKWAELMQRPYGVFAACSMEDKQRLVHMLRKESPGRILISGLHAGDIPAMRLADIGAAFDSSCPLAKAVSDVIMMNNHLSSLVNSVLTLQKDEFVNEDEEGMVASPSHWRETAPPQLAYKEHLMSMEVLIQSNTDSHIDNPDKPQGLREGEALRRLVTRGENVLPEHSLYSYSFLESQTPSHVDIIREGMEYRIESKKLVEGDVIHLTGGKHLPADVRFIHCSEDAQISKTLFVAQSNRAHLCTTESTNDVNPFLSCNMGFFGCFLLGGEVYALVVRTGPRMAISQLCCLKEQQEGRT